LNAARLALVAALLLGAASVFSFAPFGFSLLPALTLAGLFALWQHARSARAAAAVGFAFGAGFFGAGVSWVFIALHTFGGMPGVLAAIGTAGFCGLLALYPALAGWLSTHWTPASSLPRLIAAAAAWTLCEWLRSWLLSGFGWLSVGYAQVQSPLAGYAPIGGVFLTGFGLALSAALLVAIVQAAEAHRPARAAVLAALIACVWLGGYALSTLEWSRPSSAPLSVSLVQGNVEQDLKFDPEYRERTLAVYADLVTQARGRLIVLPESALPMFADEVPADYVARLRNIALARGGDLLLGLFYFEPRERADDEDRYFNSVVSIGSSMTQVYRKHHLVPFGETIPAKPVMGWLIRNVLSIPLADQTPGPAFQEPFAAAGERLAVNICYEDAFGGELARRAADATLLVNVTNDAWYGRSIAAEQHEQIAAMRAVETSRPMLRATNTGITSIVDHRGAEQGRLPWFTRGILEGTISGRTGTTPYVRFGDALVAALAMLVFGAAIFAARGSRNRATSGLFREGGIQ
jgi:apolipoprotein N-acyltransferase